MDTLVYECHDMAPAEQFWEQPDIRKNERANIASLRQISYAKSGETFHLFCP